MKKGVDFILMLSFGSKFKHFYHHLLLDKAQAGCALSRIFCVKKVQVFLEYLFFSCFRHPPLFATADDSQTGKTMVQQMIKL